MLEIASQIILCLLLAALIGAIIGYIFGKSTCASNDCNSHETDKTEDTHVAESTSVETPAAVMESSTPVAAVGTTTDDTQEEEQSMDAPEVLSGPRNGEKDNLTRIKGIGLKIESMLNDVGIYHFDQVASWNESNIAWADSTLGFPGRAKREGWVSQAAALATGEETEFSKRVDAGEVSSSKKS
ncbi:MAG: NADH-ubiquinone oxidoreductase chain E (EC [uncultured Sulfurovum sp.]|uniref:NADH-ubiquinone oxidoreductase chain E (EC) n=1 Tax=uncultured Sulfurovum sp. TaxID=269237 RepID=A0A6S6TPJ5_9BACT|nr:MAG: NADH-ubiquinone oxidoreductase chain E (EC [uncultured Sulfurovum sp.]